jgi:glycosyltransferase involved in cell wall biosynthesis
MSKSKKPRLSLITVCFNSEATIEKTFISVLTQSYENIEYIVIDGASKDRTLEIIDTYRAGIDILVSEPDKGLYDAMNKGIALATGEVIGFLNSDDTFESETSAACLMSPFSDKNVDCVYSDLVYVNHSNQIVRYWRSRSFEEGYFGKGWSPAHPTFYVRKKFYENLGGFDCHISYGNDVDLMMRYLEIEKLTSFYVPKVTVRMLIGGVSNRSLQTIWVQNTSTIYLAKKYGIPCNPIEYIIKKIYSRLTQILLRPKWGK